jgi:hypothetical protein
MAPVDAGRPSSAATTCGSASTATGAVSGATESGTTGATATGAGAVTGSATGDGAFEALRGEEGRRSGATAERIWVGASGSAISTGRGVCWTSGRAVITVADGTGNDDVGAVFGIWITGAGLAGRGAGLAGALAAGTSSTGGATCAPAGMDPSAIRTSG